MKRFLICLALMLCASSALAQGKMVADYKGMLFGKDISEFSMMKQVRQQGDLAFYSKYGDDHVFQGVPIKDQLYGFYKGKFCLALFTAQGPSSYNVLKGYFDSTFGQPSQPKMNVKQFNYTAGEVSIELGYDDARKVAEISYSYRPIMRQMMPGK